MAALTRSAYRPTAPASQTRPKTLASRPTRSRDTVHVATTRDFQPGKRATCGLEVSSLRGILPEGHGATVNPKPVHDHVKAVARARVSPSLNLGRVGQGGDVR